jgi:foldase protein PrsA
MFRRLLAILAVALLAASCSSSNTLATVNGTDITKDDLYRIYPDYENATVVDFTGEQLRQAVTDLIVLETSLQAASAEFAVDINDAKIADRLVNPPKRYVSLLAQGGADEGFTEVQKQRAVVSLLIDEVSPLLVEAQLDGWAGVLESHPEYVTRACVRHINVATEDEATQVLTRLEDGEDFAALAAELSQDTASEGGLLRGGDGDCLASWATLDQDLATMVSTAEMNVPLGPVQFGSGFSVIRIEDRVEPTVDELTADPMRYLDLNIATDYYYSWASDVLRTTDIEVSPALGTWSSVGFGITPPPQ